MNEVKKIISGKEFKIETGNLAQLASGAVVVSYGDNVVLVTSTVSKDPIESREMFPLVVEYRERAYATGKIPGGFFKREGRPREKEITTCRLIDRPLRPLFPKGFFNEIQIIAYVLSSDQENNSDVLALIGASAALSISNIPFLGPIGACRVGLIDDQIVINPTFNQLKTSSLDMVIAGKKGSIVMIEGSAKVVDESIIIKAIEQSKETIESIISLQEELVSLAGKQKTEFSIFLPDKGLEEKIKNEYSEKITQAYYHPDKNERKQQVEKLRKEIIADLSSGDKDKAKEIKNLLEKTEGKEVRKKIINTSERPDGRTPDEIREINCKVGALPRTHGSAVFTRGQTQALVVTTLGTEDDVQVIEELVGESKKRYMLQYNFPPFSVGEVKPLRGPGRREIGHGALAERAILSMLPSKEQFPYTIQVVSDILQSNGSSSMATVCGASLSLMDAGVPIKSHIAGIAMGLIKEEDKAVVLTDIQGIEDHCGDMDFKVAGTREGITAFQMDIKIDGLSIEIFQQALMKAKQARLFILDKMEEALPVPRPEISEYAPHITTITINPDKIKDVIGPGGKIIKKIIEETGVSIEIQDAGKINIASTSSEAAQKAILIIREIAKEAEIGKIYRGKVKKIMDFGAFVEIFPGTDGLVHISQLDEQRVRRVEDVLREGQEVMVKVIDIENGKIKLSRKEALREAVPEKQ